MAKTFKIKGDKIIVTQCIEIEDYAMLLKYDWHLYNLSKDVQTARNSSFRKYLKRALELFTDEVAKSRPNKRIDLFGEHSVFYFLYGHTGDWVSAAEREVQCEKDLLTCISGDSWNSFYSIIRNSPSLTAAQVNACKTFGIQPQSAQKILGMKLNQLSGIVESRLRESIVESEAFLQKLIELDLLD